MKILIAPNAFKNSLPASDAANAIHQGLLHSGLSCDFQCFPIGDGGDGTGELIVHYLKGVSFETSAADPIGRQIKTSIGLLDQGKTAVIEMANISGLKLLHTDELDPLHTSSLGTGQLIQTALEKGARKVILCIGGSATVDGGCGILQALGIRFLDKTKRELKGLPENLLQLDSIDISGMDKRISKTEFIVLCDVDNFLLGKQGAAEIFGPQKGASKQEVEILENALGKLNEVTLLQMGKNMSTIRHGGAAGGAAAALHVFLNAKLVQGIDYFLDFTSFDTALKETDILITGEGSIDLQTLNGKGPYGVAKRAKKNGMIVIGLAGAVPLRIKKELSVYFDSLFAIGHQPEDPATALQNAFANIERTAMQIGNLLALSKK